MLPLVLSLACWSTVPEVPPPAPLVVIAPASADRVSLACADGARTLPLVDGRAVFEGLDGSCTLRVEADPVVHAEGAIVVNGHGVPDALLQQAAARVAPEGPDGLTASQRAEVVDQVIHNELLRQEALRLELDLDPKVQKVLVNTLLREQVYAQVRNSDFTDDELRAYFQANQSEFVVPEKVQLKQILIRYGEDRTEAEARALAESLVPRITPDTFKELALEHSEDPYKRRGGDVGFVSAEGKPGLDPGLVAAAFNAPMNTPQLHDQGDGWVVFMVVNRRAQVARTFEQMKGSVLRKVKNERLAELYDAYVLDLRRTAVIEVDQAAVDALELAPLGSMPRPGAQDIEQP